LQSKPTASFQVSAASRKQETMLAFLFYLTITINNCPPLAGIAFVKKKTETNLRLVKGN
jgi:hypothetical protein